MRPGDDDPGQDPLSELLRRMGLNVPAQGLDLNAMMGQFQQAMSQAAAHTDSSTGIDWDATKQAARHVVASLGPDPSPTQTQRAQLADADRLAESWLDPVTTFAPADAPAEPWSRAQWVDDTMDSWRAIVEPIVTAIADAMSKAMGGQAMADAPELAQLSGMLGPILRGAAGQMYAAQLSEAIGKVAADVLTGAELGVQLLSKPRVVVLPTNANAFVRGLELPDEDVLMYLTLREAARQRLFARVTWLGPQLLALIEHYARGITIDMAALGEVIDPDSMAGLTPTSCRSCPSSSRDACSPPPALRSRRRCWDGWRRSWHWLRAGSTRSPMRLPRAGSATRKHSWRSSADAGQPAGRRRRCSAPWSAWNCVRAGCAMPSGCGRPCRRPAAPRVATRCGPTLT